MTYVLTQDLPSYHAMAYYEIFRNGAKDMREPCHAFYLPEHKDDYSTYRQIVWTQDGSEFPKIKNVHMYVSASLAPVVRKEFSRLYGARNVEEVGVTYAFGHTMGVDHLVKNDESAMYSLTDSIRQNNRILHFMSNVFNTKEGSSFLLSAVKQTVDPVVLHQTLQEKNGYEEVKSYYIDQYQKNQYGSRKSVEEQFIQSFTNCFTQKTTEEMIADRFAAFLDNDLSDRAQYTQVVENIQKRPTLMQNVAYK